MASAYDLILMCPEICPEICENFCPKIFFGCAQAWLQSDITRTDWQTARCFTGRRVEVA